jgi:hypothetical protein
MPSRSHGPPNDPDLPDRVASHPVLPGHYGTPYVIRPKGTGSLDYKEGPMRGARNGAARLI